MSSSESSPSPFLGFDHVRFYVSNAKQSAEWMCMRFGFDLVAFKGMENGCKDGTQCHVVKNNNVCFVFQCALSDGEQNVMNADVNASNRDDDGSIAGTANDDQLKSLSFGMPLVENESQTPSTHTKNPSLDATMQSTLLLDSTGETAKTLQNLNKLPRAISKHVAKHGDGVKDVAFRVRDAKSTFDMAIAKGAIPVQYPETQSDEFGSVVLASVQTYGDTIHTFVERTKYHGPFLPDYRAVKKPPSKWNENKPDLVFIDHVVGNQGEKQMIPIADWYRDKLGFHRFWSVDDSQIHSEYSSLRSIVMADESLRIKMPINEPAGGLRKSQIQEFVDFYAGPGVQHIALNTPNCVDSVEKLKSRGVEFLEIPDSYYDTLQERLTKARIDVKQDIRKLRELNILVDFDQRGFLLQIFTKPLGDRPTVFLEIIQRAGNDGFGAGNFKALFEAIEREQMLRGNL